MRPDQARLLGRAEVPTGFTGRLDADEHVLASATTGDGVPVVVTSLGLWVPDPDGTARRVGWHLINKASWAQGTITLIEAEEIDTVDGALLITDRPPRRLRLAEPGTGARDGARPGRGVDQEPAPPGAARRRCLVRAAQGARPRRGAAAGPARPGHRRAGRAPGGRSGRGRRSERPGDDRHDQLGSRALPELRRPPLAPVPRSAGPRRRHQPRAGSSTSAAGRGT